jgi:two-component system, response regulator YesN
MPKPSTIRARRDLLRRAKAAVRERYSEFDLILDDIAEDVGASRRQLQRVFIELQGESFRAYLLRIRMQEAARRLRRGGTVRATAPRVGFRKPSGLRQAFLRFYGANPSSVKPPPPNYDDFWREAEQRADGAAS